MADAPRVLALIPARGGSKRLPRKNVLPFAGKPLIAWTVEAALRSGAVDRVVVSSDDPEIIAAAVAAGAEAPFVRPDALASDSAGSADVVVHALEALPEPYDYVVMLQPTSPLRDARDIAEAVRLCVASGAATLVSVCPSPKPKSYYGAVRDGRFAFRDFFGHDAPVCTNGALYVVAVAPFLRERLFYKDDTLAYEMSVERSIDIDDIHEFRMAEALARGPEG